MGKGWKGVQCLQHDLGRSILRFAYSSFLHLFISLASVSLKCLLCASYSTGGIKRNKTGASLAVQCLRLQASNAAGTCLIPGQRTNIPHTVPYGQKIFKKNGGAKQWIPNILICFSCLPQNVLDDSGQVWKYDWDATVSLKSSHPLRLLTFCLCANYQEVTSVSCTKTHQF